jgi:hypothetical protein
MERNQNTPSAEQKLQKLRHDYEALKQEIAALGQVVPGSLQKRQYSCGKPSCRCVKEGILHGPYYQWSRKIDGKTVNINLEKEVATLVRTFSAVVGQNVCGSRRKSVIRTCWLFHL